MLIWLEALTPKQALLMISIKRELERRGHHCIITTRRHDYIVGIFRIWGEKPKIIGRYGGETLYGKLKASLSRSMKLAEYIGRKEKRPEIHISLSSPDASRVAFGLRIPIILLNDTPHSTYVNRLTLPLAEKVITPKAIPKKLFKYAVEEDRIIQYNGVDEVAWIRRFKPNRKVLRKLGLREKDKIIVIRGGEFKASYYQRKGNIMVDKIIEKLEEENVKIVYFPRYRDEMERMRRKHPKIIIPIKAVDAQSLMKFSTLVITGGGTMAREAALMGTPSIYLFQAELPVNRWLMEKGFPIKRITDYEKLIDYCMRILENPDKYRINTSKILSKLESPIQPITKLLEE